MVAFESRYSKILPLLGFRTSVTAYNKTGITLTDEYHCHYDLLFVPRSDQNRSSYHASNPFYTPFDTATLTSSSDIYLMNHNPYEPSEIIESTNQCFFDVPDFVSVIQFFRVICFEMSIRIWTCITILIVDHMSQQYHFLFNFDHFSDP